MAQKPDKRQRTERPTRRRIERAYEEGNLPRSVEVGQAISLTVLLGWAFFGGGAFLAGSMNRVRNGLTATAGPVGADALLDRLMGATTGAMTLCAPVLAIMIVVAVVAQIAHTGFHPRKTPVPFELERLDPVKGLKNFITLDKLFQGVKAVARVALYAAVAFVVLVPEWDAVAGLALEEPGRIFTGTMGIALRALVRALLLGAALALIDVGFTRYRWRRKLFMTKQQVKDELKEHEGAPLLKGRIRERQRQASRRRTTADVRKPDAATTNPVHAAVALECDRVETGAAVVPAKGRGRIARQVKQETEAPR
ncbi:MAG: EscU/YscU/HrcU family type III secretion system export apparatus switch protein [Acidobacteriota bacterium]|nr:EscU/YscU/HrcU family type III secretion system export apparatus switch protein [Acidobacteriota bacterium]